MNLKRYSTDVLEFWTKYKNRLKPKSAWTSKLDLARGAVEMTEFLDNSCMEFQVMFSFGFGVGKNGWKNQTKVTKEYAKRALVSFVESLDCKQHIVCFWSGDWQKNGSYHLHGLLHFENKVVLPAKIKALWDEKYGDGYTAAYVKRGGYGEYLIGLHEEFDYFHRCPNRTSRCKKFDRHECDYVKRAALPMT